MSEVIREYGGMVLAAGATFSLLGLLGILIFSGDGLLAELVYVVGNGGC